MLSLQELGVDKEKLDKLAPKMAEDAISATLAYAEDLYDQDYDTNGIVVVITDGYDNASNLGSPQSISSKLSSLITDERKIESLNTILIGVNSAQYANELNKTIGINIFQLSIPPIFGLNAINAIYDINAITSRIIIYLKFCLIPFKIL